MTESKAPERPRQVTLAAWLIMGGSALVVASVFERISGLHTLESQEAVQRFLAEPPGEGLGLDEEAVTSLLRILSMVAGACATAAAILGFHVLKRSKSARLALAVVAPPLFVSGMAVGGFLPSLVAAACVMLWLQPARDWFNGVTRRPAETAAPAAAPPPPPPGPRAMSGFGSPPGSETRSSVQTLAPPAVVAESASAGAPASASGQRTPETRPGALLAACVVTWTLCSLAAGLMAMSVLVLLAAPDLVFDELHRQDPQLASNGLSDADIRSATFVTAAVVIVWSAAAIAFAVLAVRRIAWGHRALLVSAVMAALVCLVGAAFNLLLAVPFAGCLAAVILLTRPEVRRWFA